MKEKVRPIYAELKARLAQAPSPGSGSFSDKEVWDGYNKIIQELNEVSQGDYSRFSVISTPNKNYRDGLVSVLDYRTKLNSLIARLHVEYLPDEPEPFGSLPTTLINQSQSQSQLMHVQILLDIQGKIDEKIGKYKTGTKERTFLEKIKGSLSGVNNIIELLNMIFKIGKDAGLTLEQITSLLS